MGRRRRSLPIPRRTAVEPSARPEHRSPSAEIPPLRAAIAEHQALARARRAREAAETGFAWPPDRHASGDSA